MDRYKAVQVMKRRKEIQANQKQPHPSIRLLHFQHALPDEIFDVRQLEVVNAVLF